MSAESSIRIVSGPRDGLGVVFAVGLVGLALAFPPPTPAQQAEPASPPAASLLAKFRLDVGKGAIERPTENLLTASANPLTNPKVEPGKVRWHADFAAAKAAADKSGKPVLLFQMMGKLDDRFC